MPDSFKTLIRTICLLTVCLFMAADGEAWAQWENRLTFEEGEEGWIMLFYGRDLEGWESHGEATWTVEDGTIVGGDGAGFLVTEEEFGDFELSLEFLATPGANSGLFVRTKPWPVDVLKDCYEINIAPPDNAFPTGSIVGRRRVEGIDETEDWRRLHIEAFRDEIIVRVDGVTVLEFTDPEPILRGRVSLQHREGRVSFRNIKIRYLDL